jgi:hypothetical protein
MVSSVGLTPLPTGRTARSGDGSIPQFFLTRWYAPTLAGDNPL